MGERSAARLSARPAGGAPRVAAERAAAARVTAARLTSQLLAGEPARDAYEVVTHLLAVQGQDPRGARLAIRARSVGLSAADVDRALTDDRSLVITWLQRGTLHLVAAEDYPWLFALTAPTLVTANARRLGQLDVGGAIADRGIAAIERALTREGPLTRGQLRERVDAAGVPTTGQALVHLLVEAHLRGVALRGPMVGGEHAFVLVRDWLAAPPAFDRDRALAELARRYLVGHGPADARDLARWAGLPLRDARAGLSAVASRLRERDDGLLELAGAGPTAPLPPPRLLGAFDPLLLGWCSRQPILGEHEGVVTVNGLFRPFALVRGRGVATWRLAGGEVAVEPFGVLSRRDAAALAADARDVQRFLGV